MKVLRLLTICLAVIGLFTGQTFAALNAGIGISIRAEFQGTDTLAFVAEDGDVIEYIVTVELSSTQFPITNGEPTLTLPNGTVIDLDDDLALATGTSIEYPPQAYTVNIADLGQRPGAAANEVRALAAVTADSQTGQTVQDVTATTNFDTIVVNPCVEVTKTAECNIAKEGDTFDYVIEISNCGGDELTAVSIEDTMFGSLLPECAVLAPGQTCTITIPYTVQPGDPDPLENTVTVVYEVTAAPAIEVTDSDDAEVDLIYPDFTVTKECLTDGVVAPTVTFQITIDNTGDVPLNFTTDEAEIPPFTLAPGDLPLQIQVDRDVAPGETEVSNTINVVATLPAEYVCDENDATLEDSASDTCTVLEADFTVTKECITPEVMVGEMARFLITITNTGDVALDFVTDEPEIAPFSLSAGGIFTKEVERLAESGMENVSNSITVTATYLAIEITKDDSADCAVISGDEGCTPGYWKNHPACWGCYSPQTLVGDVWVIPSQLSALADDTLMQALNYRGGTGLIGGARILLRQATAALLNSCNEDVNYPLDTDTVISAGNDALASLNRSTMLGLYNVLTMFNEYGCPIDAHCRPNGDEEIVP